MGFKPSRKLLSTRFRYVRRISTSKISQQSECDFKTTGVINQAITGYEVFLRRIYYWVRDKPQRPRWKIGVGYVRELSIHLPRRRREKDR